MKPRGKRIAKTRLGASLAVVAIAASLSLLCPEPAGPLRLAENEPAAERAHGGKTTRHYARVEDFKRPARAKPAPERTEVAARELRALAEPGPTLVREKWLFGKKPLERRISKVTFDVAELAPDEIPAGQTYPGDVFIKNVPMIDQGDRSFCAVATAVRLLSVYGIDVSLDEVADMMGASETEGTQVRRWEDVLREVLGKHDLELAFDQELTMSAKPISETLNEYNGVADALRSARLEYNDYVRPGVVDFGTMREDMQVDVRREMLAGDETKSAAFGMDVFEKINSSDPLVWSVTLGNVPEQGEMPQDKGGHMRLIIGYNLERDEILYTDSWGEGHDLKRMPSADALTITDGIFYVK